MLVTSANLVQSDRIALGAENKQHYHSLLLSRAHLLQTICKVRYSIKCHTFIAQGAGLASLTPTIKFCQERLVHFMNALVMTQLCMPEHAYFLQLEIVSHFINLAVTIHPAWLSIIAKTLSI